MSCSPFDLRDYFLRELTDAERRQMEVHLKGCPECREELERLRITEAALLTLGEEEIPQRIGFVSDKVFEPSALRRWWQAFWGSAARLGFASAAMLSVALLVATLGRPAPAPPIAQGTAAQVDTAKLETAFSARLHEAVRQAVAESEARQAKKTDELLAAIEKRNQETNRARSLELVRLEENVDYLQRKFNTVRSIASAQLGDSQ
jgi:anti-sigma factor RsiW